MQINLKDLFREAVNKAYWSSFETGFVGRPDPDNPGHWIFEVPGRGGHYFYVRVYRGSTVSVDIAINFGAARDPNLPVLIGRDQNGERFIQGLNPTLAAQSLANKPASGAGIHSHALGTGLEDIVESMRFLPGRVYAVGGMQVRIEPFDFPYSGFRYRYEGGYYDITSDLPTTAGMYAWVVIYLDPATNTIGASTGAEYGSKQVLTEVRKNQVYIPNTIPLMGIRTFTGQTVLDSIWDFSDCRLFLGLTAPYANMFAQSGFLKTNGVTVSSAVIQQTASDPTVNDDTDLGYEIGSLWLNTSSGELFICSDGTDGAAVWKSLG